MSGEATEHDAKEGLVFNGPISDQMYKLFINPESVSSLLAKDPSMAPGKAWKELYGHHTGNHVDKHDENDHLERAAECGHWGPTQPSELFLKQWIPDIVRHMANCIVRAEKEVFLATNYWANSTASKFITDAMRELSRRAGERGTKVVFKLIYDRGSPKQLVEPHYVVSEKEFTGPKVKIPAPHEIPNIDLQVMNYHHPLLGTFHCKYMIVDRKIAILQSNNIQDNENLEMMVHMEGPIVDSLYDMALISWHKGLEPPLPSHNSPATQGGLSCFDESHKGLFGPNGSIRTTAFLNAGQQPGNHVPLPTGASDSLPELTADDQHYDDNIAGEVLRVQASVSAKQGETQLQAVNRHLNHTINVGFPADAPECAPEDEMTPYIPHTVHEPFPIAMVNRAPYGTPNHKSVSMPQNAAWLSALRNAKKSVFIQSPTLNAEPLVPEIIAACERGIDVYCYICLGYNDSGELLPMQGGHNDMIAHKLYTSLSGPAKDRLHYFWYVAKDQTKPIIQEKKKRSCHIKLMIVDERIGIQGNGNQDTQSWFHSQEINVLLESEQVCRAWIDGLRRNQNTHIYGALNKETGIWTDDQGNMADGAIGVDPGRFAWAKGITGAIKRVQGVGGF
ncbi:hypothetical protein M406DRAFT_252746 [Cryphonectria parasitica EP155]|uniref:PLD phosphodiesterase domain-containing protein n=1 Tax=Cryphonectria parasitica (strain ATCC 38755 / EP155) TaxID=660469 RepID=A0A9P4Y893_CRYP1|nr:uncharacterized protein M406DRAFT_252746 [Cryphonectria parasitica EP155]KAF3767910.1 hypothetical protein M406DRAFT_252746 [Cryphonectria parasitica EP155]